MGTALVLLAFLLGLLVVPRGLRPAALGAVVVLGGSLVARAAGATGFESLAAGLLPLLALLVVREMMETSSLLARARRPRRRPGPRPRAVEPDEDVRRAA